jgi:hypothetical protein
MVGAGYLSIVAGVLLTSNDRNGSNEYDDLMKVYPDLQMATSAHAVNSDPALVSGRPQTANCKKKAECLMLTLAIVALVLVPIGLDFALRGRHQTIELSMARQK